MTRANVHALFLYGLAIMSFPLLRNLIVLSILGFVILVYTLFYIYILLPHYVIFYIIYRMAALIIIFVRFWINLYAYTV